jgi:NAD-dependent dihydropyrimidine dehydrogenase PreA subunit/bacterioferritin-associated ferredoxin
MKVVNVQSQVVPELCKGCKTCQMVCPVYAVAVTREGGKPRVDIDLKKCVGCWNCEQRCPEHAIRMVPCEPFTLKTDISRFDYREIEALCRKARFHPKQVVCYCSASRAEELAAAILSGAKTPDAVVLATGIGAGCGIECNQPVQRFLEAAGVRFERVKESYQWYGRTATVWEVSPEVKARHATFRFIEDGQLMDRIADAPLKP